MNLFTKKTHLALNAVIFVAYHATRENPVSGSTISDHYGMNKRSLESVLQILGGADLLQSVRGNSGGYYVEDSSKISVADVARALVGDPEAPAPDEPFFEFSSLLDVHLKNAETLFWEELSTTTIQSLCLEGRSLSIPPIGEPIITFNI